MIASDLTLGDTIDVGISDTSYAGRVNKGVFTVFAENGFPFGAEIQLYILDANGVTLDSVFADNVVLPAIVDGNNIVTNEVASILYLDLDEAATTHLYENNRMVLKAKFNTVDAANGHTKLYDHNKLDLMLVADFEYTVDLSDE